MTRGHRPGDPVRSPQQRVVTAHAELEPELWLRLPRPLDRRHVVPIVLTALQHTTLHSASLRLLDQVAGPAPSSEGETTDAVHLPHPGVAAVLCPLEPVVDVHDACAGS